ncbi:MAG: class I SAM-dependent methyltransferase [Caldilineaceae bacterium]
MNAPLETNVELICPVCGNKQWESYLNLGKYGVVKCRTCGLGQTYPFPSDHQQSEVNLNVYSLEKRLQAYNIRFNELLKRYQKQLIEIEKYRTPATKNLLDIGCSLGFFLVAARKMGFATYGVELSKETADYARTQQNLEIFCGTLEQANYSEGQFDVITLWDVLEHVPDLHNLLTEIHRILCNKGLLVIQSPNMDSLMAEIGREYWNWWLLPDHLYHFTPDTLESLLRNHGFIISATYTWEPSLDFLMNWFISKLHTRSDDITLKSRLLRKIAWLISNTLWPLVVPIQQRAWRQNRGALVTVYASKAG